MKCQEKSTKDRILEEALVLFAKKVLHENLGD